MSNTQLTAGAVAGRRPFAGRALRFMAVAGTIRGTVLIACLAISLLTGALGLYATIAIHQAGALVKLTYDQSLMSISYARAAGSDIAAMETATLRMRLSADPARQLVLAQDIESASESLGEDLRIAVRRSQSPYAAAAAATVLDSVTQWRDLLRQLPAAADRTQLPKLLMSHIDTAIAKAHEDIDTLTELAAGEGFRHRESAVALIRRLTAITMTGTLAALLLSAAISWLLARRLIGPVAAASAAAKRIAGGDMQVAIPSGGRDELGQLLKSMAVMRDSIRTMMDREVAQRRSAQAWLAEALENSGEGVILIDPDGGIALVNTQAMSLLSSVAELLVPGTDFARLSDAARLHGLTFNPDSVGTPEAMASPDGEGRGQPAAWLAAGWSGESETQLGDGRWLRVSRSFTGDGGSIAILNDITALKAYQEALEKANLRFTAALNHMSQGLVLFDEEDRLQVLNERFREIYRLPVGMPPLGIGFRTLVELRVNSSEAGERTAEAVYHEHAALIEAGEAATFFEETADHKTIAIAHVPIEHGGWVATFEDITDQRRTMAQVQFMSRHDELTGLGNRATFIEQLALALAQLPPDGHIAVLHLDLDHFKPVNDTLGHPVGDRLLHAVAQRLTECHDHKDQVFRHGGDEFAIIHAGLDGPDDAAVLARRIIAAIGQDFAISGHDISLGVSIGIAMAPRDGTTAERLAEAADLAMDCAKNDERGAFRFFEPEMNERLQKRRMFENDLRKALAENELELYFQPLVNLEQKRISGFEALLRWRHPVRGMVSPGDFIPLAEELGLIVPIGEWVLLHACQVAATWPADIKVAVNVSPIQFRSPLLVRAVADALAKSGLEPGRLELEITESVLLASNDTTLGTLRDLKQLGTRIAMDDFGTGYSSLSYLRSFPFDKIKIDQSFVRELQGGNNSGAIVDAIAAMARSLDMRTVAEGVETADQLEMVRAAGCTEVQGYLFSKPRPSGEVPLLLVQDLSPILG